jgi:hypothetical protein
MERTNKPINNPNEEQKIGWKNRGGGSFWLLGHIIKPGQLFQAKVSEIPTAFRDVLIPVDGIPEPNKPIVEGKISTYTIQPRGKSTSLFDVVNEAGKVINAKGLTKEKGEKLIQDLSA